MAKLRASNSGARSATTRSATAPGVAPLGELTDTNNASPKSKKKVGTVGAALLDAAKKQLGS